MIFLLYDWLKKKYPYKEEELVAGLWVGLWAGLVAGLWAGLLAGLLAGLAIGLPFEWWLVVAVIVLLTEVIYWLKPVKVGKKENTFWLAVKHKLFSLVDAAIIFFNANWIYRMLPKIPWNEVLKWIGYLGAGLIVCAIAAGALWAFIKLNELKFKK
jgi:hypothetical protein